MADTFDIFAVETSGKETGRRDELKAMDSDAIRAEAVRNVRTLDDTLSSLFSELGDVYGDDVEMTDAERFALIVGSKPLSTLVKSAEEAREHLQQVTREVNRRKREAAAAK